jgi:hypothetical protein
MIDRHLPLAREGHADRFVVELAHGASQARQ